MMTKLRLLILSVLAKGDLVQADNDNLLRVCQNSSLEYVIIYHRLQSQVGTRMLKQNRQNIAILCVKQSGS